MSVPVKANKAKPTSPYRRPLSTFKGKGARDFQPVVQYSRTQFTQLIIHSVTVPAISPTNEHYLCKFSDLSQQINNTHVKVRSHDAGNYV